MKFQGKYCKCDACISIVLHEGEIRKQLLPHYFQVLGGLDAAKSLIEEIVAIVRAGRTKRAQ